MAPLHDTLKAIARPKVGGHFTRHCRKGTNHITYIWPPTRLGLEDARNAFEEHGLWVTVDFEVAMSGNQVQRLSL
jgi:hypothetical protein